MNNMAKKDPIKEANSNAIIPAPEELLPDGGAYVAPVQLA
jgi:hypothetical protein